MPSVRVLLLPVDLPVASHRKVRDLVLVLLEAVVVGVAAAVMGPGVF